MARLLTHYKYNIGAVKMVEHIVGTYFIAVYHNGDSDSFVKSDASNQILYTVLYTEESLYRSNKYLVLK